MQLVASLLTALPSDASSLQGFWKAVVALFETVLKGHRFSRADHRSLSHWGALSWSNRENLFSASENFRQFCSMRMRQIANFDRVFGAPDHHI
jgi:hypothetical protein